MLTALFCFKRRLLSPGTPLHSALTHRIKFVYERLLILRKVLLRLVKNPVVMAVESDPSLPERSSSNCEIVREFSLFGGLAQLLS